MRDWNTGEGFTNGLTQDDILYLRWAIANERDDAYRRGRQDAANAVEAIVPHSYDCVVMRQLMRSENCYCSNGIFAAAARGGTVVKTAGEMLLELRKARAQWMDRAARGEGSHE